MSTPTRNTQRSSSSVNSTPTKLSQLSRSTTTCNTTLATTSSLASNATQSTISTTTNSKRTQPTYNSNSNNTNDPQQQQMQQQQNPAAAPSSSSRQLSTSSPTTTRPSTMSSVYGQNSGLEILTCADIKEMTGIKIPSLNDTWWCILEFSCQEVRECSDDLVIFFASSTEMQRFLRLLEQLWQAKNVSKRNLYEMFSIAKILIRTEQELN